MLNCVSKCFLIFGVFATILIQACYKDEANKYLETSKPAIVLSSTESGSGIILGWEKINVSGFKEYIVVGNTQSNPIPAKSLSEISPISILFRSNNFNTTSFKDSLSFKKTVLSYICLYWKSPFIFR